MIASVATGVKLTPAPDEIQALPAHDRRSRRSCICRGYRRRPLRALVARDQDGAPFGATDACLDRGEHEPSSQELAEFGRGVEKSLRLVTRKDALAALTRLRPLVRHQLVCRVGRSQPYPHGVPENEPQWGPARVDRVCGESFRVSSASGPPAPATALSVEAEPGSRDVAAVCSLRGIRRFVRCNGVA